MWSDVEVSVITFESDTVWTWSLPSRVISRCERTDPNLILRAQHSVLARPTRNPFRKFGKSTLWTPVLATMVSELRPCYGRKANVWTAASTANETLIRSCVGIVISASFWSAKLRSVPWSILRPELPLLSLTMAPSEYSLRLQRGTYQAGGRNNPSLTYF